MKIRFRAFRQWGVALCVIQLLIASHEASAQEGQPNAGLPGQTPAPPATPNPGPAPAVSDASVAVPVTAPEANAEPVPNTDASDGPPESALSSSPTATEEESAPHRPGWYVDKGNSPYLDVVTAWGWANNSYLVNISFLNMYLHDSGDAFGFHGRMFALGVLSFEQQRVGQGVAPGGDRKTTFLLEVIDPSLRFYLAEPVFAAAGFNFGIAFYDGVVPTLDLQGGLGFEYHGWGLEAGVRTSRLPREVTAVNGTDFVHTRYGGQLYLDLETNLPW